MVEWPRILQKDERVEVSFDGYLVFGKREWGTIVKLKYGPDDPHYLVELDHSHPEVPGLNDGKLWPDETVNRRWFAWEFVRPLSLLELVADAAR
jgi:hypothetical protein